MPPSAEPARSADDPSRPLASYVLRVLGPPDALRFELLNLRDGARHHFRRAQSVADLLQAHGGLPDAAAATRNGGSEDDALNARRRP